MVRAVAVTPDGRFAIPTSLDNTLKVWQWENGACLMTLRLGEVLFSSAVAPDSRTIIAGGVSGRLHVLRLENV